MKSISNSIHELVEHLPIIELYLVFHEVPHSIVLAQVLELSQLLLVPVDCVTLRQLLLKLEPFFSFFLELLNF
jgi:hypothetical protein